MEANGDPFKEKKDCNGLLRLELVLNTLYIKKIDIYIIKV